MAISTLSSRGFKPPSYVYVSDDFRDMLSMHRNLIDKQEGTTTITVSQFKADKHYGDFHGLLLDAGQQPHHLWLLTMLNGLNCSTDYSSDFLDIKIPDAKYLDRLIDIFNTMQT